MWIYFFSWASYPPYVIYALLFPFSSWGSWGLGNCELAKFVPPVTGGVPECLPSRYCLGSSQLASDVVFANSPSLTALTTWAPFLCRRPLPSLFCCGAFYHFSIYHHYTSPLSPLKSQFRDDRYLCCVHPGVSGTEDNAWRIYIYVTVDQTFRIDMCNIKQHDFGSPPPMLSA